jgi:hypothetical protein
MSRLAVLVVRRFHLTGRQEITELSRAVELAIPPGQGMVLAFEDGSPECTISRVRHRTGVAASAGICPIEVELIGAKEPDTSLHACLEAGGWQRVGEPPQAPAP